jgi:D-serine deaminase-like pyridoxal phosphate-dependent protein
MIPTPERVMMEEHARLQDMETPAVLIDAAQLTTNLESMQRLADENGVALRPHAKTHKSVEIGRRQLALGATGLTVATVEEALVFLANGFKSITVSRPIVSGSALQRLVDAGGQTDAELRVVVDSEEGVRVAAQQTDNVAMTLGVFVKIDVGLNRCGIDPESMAPVELARQISLAPNLYFRGILSHAGQAYAADSAAKAAEIAAVEQGLMLKVRDALLENNIEVPEISVGSTPTVLAASSFDGITEIRPGNYAFLDLLPINVGVATQQDVALTVLATVISKNDQFFVTDAGSKTLTSDAGVHGMSSTKGFGLAYPAEHYLSPAHGLVVAGLSEEHGKLTRSDFDLSIGSKVRIIPNHSCPVANLARHYTVINENGNVTWPIDAGLCSR